MAVKWWADRSPGLASAKAGVGYFHKTNPKPLAERLAAFFHFHDAYFVKGLIKTWILLVLGIAALLTTRRILVSKLMR